MAERSRPIDHLVHAVSDLDAAAGEYEAMGFVVTPRSDHPFGTSNRLIVLADSYVELVAVTKPDLLSGVFARGVESTIQAGGGLAWMVIRSQDVEVDWEAAASAGVDGGDMLRFSRQAPRPDGTDAEASFSVLIPADLVGLGMFLCQHHTPEAIWDPGYMVHSNGAVRLAKVRGEGEIDAGGARAAEVMTGSRLSTTPAGQRLDVGRVPVEIARSGASVLRLTGFDVEGGRAARAVIAGVEVGVSAGR